MSNTQSRPQSNSQDEFGNGIWRLWPFSIISRSLQKNQQSLEMRLLQLNEQQESMAIREAALSVALKKVEQISLQHQQNNTVEIDRLEQEIAHIVEDKVAPVEKNLKTLQQQSGRMFAEIESSASRIVDTINALQQLHTSASDKPPELQNSSIVGKSALNELADQSAALQYGHLLETALNSMQKDILALQAQVRSQAIRVNALATLAGETLPDVKGNASDSGEILANEFKRLSARERSIAQQFKLLSDATH